MLAASLLLIGTFNSYQKRRSLRLGNELIESSSEGDVRKMQELIAAGADVNFNLTPHPNCIPLTCAAREGRVEAVQLLLDRGADVNGRDDSHKTALQWAREEGHAEMMALLKEASAIE